MKVSEERRLSVQLKLSNYALAVAHEINEIKDSDPILAGKLYTEFDNMIRQNAPTTTVFSLKELAEYGYIN